MAKSGVRVRTERQRQTEGQRERGERREREIKKKEIRKTVPFTIDRNNVKYLVVTLTE